MLPFAPLSLSLSHTHTYRHTHTHTHTTYIFSLFLSFARSLARPVVEYAAPLRPSPSNHSLRALRALLLIGDARMAVFGYLSGIRVIARTRASSLVKISTPCSLSLTLSHPLHEFASPRHARSFFFNHPSDGSDLSSRLTRLPMQQIAIRRVIDPTHDHISSRI